MNYVRFGSTGLEVSRLCFGCMSVGTPDAKRAWVLDEAAARPLIRHAWDLGVTFYDTANIYGFGSSEEITGKVLRDIAPRDSYVLATKLFHRMQPGPNRAGLGRKAIFAELDDSLRRLGTDYIDLYQIHRHDPFTPIEETLEALNDAVRAGKVRYIGASSMFAWQFAKALFRADIGGWTRFVSMQCQLSLIAREEEREMLGLCADQGIAVMPWSPLGGGKLTRPWGTETARSRHDGLYPQKGGAEARIVAEVARIADERGTGMAQVALAWVLGQGTVPIIGATRAGHLDAAVAALDLTLSEADRAALEAPYLPLPVPRYVTTADIVRRGRLPAATGADTGAGA